MTLHKDIGSETYNVETGDGSVDVSYVPEEVKTEVPEEMSDAQRLETGEITVDDGKDEIFVDPNSVFGKKPDEKKEEEVKEPEGEEVKAKEGEEEVKTDEKKSEKEEKKEVKKPGEISPEVEKLAKKFSQKRINKISREKFQLRDENEKLRKELSELRKKSRDVEFIKKRAEHTTAKPKPEDFASDAEFYEALGRWGAKDEIYEHEASKPVVDDTAGQRTPDEDFADITKRIVEDGEDKYDDFAEIVLKTDGSIVITPEMVLAAADSDNAADIFYYLGQNPQESHRIAKLNSMHIAREIGKIESQFAVKEVEVHTPDQDSELLEKEKNKQKQTKPAPPAAPAPVKPLGGGGKTAVDLESADLASYYEARGFDRTGFKKRANS